MEQILKIAAVDDEKETIDYLAKKIDVYMQDEGLKYTLISYNSGEAFAAALENERFNIVFMDIYMDGMTGLDAAAILRRNDLDCKLVFLTTTDLFLKRGYAYNCAQYLLKGDIGELIDHNEFLQAMANCRIERQFDVPFLDIVSEREPLRLHTSQITYIDSIDKSTMVHLEHRVYTVWESFEKITKPLLADCRFLLCIRGVLVNMDFISAIEGNSFLMKDGTCLPMTVRERKNLIRQYQNYQLERAISRGGNCL